MPSVPQLQSDINKLQSEKRELQKRIKELEDRGQKVVYRDGPERIVTKRVEVPVEKIVTKRVEVPVEKIVYRDKVKEVPGPVREKTVTVTEYQDDPKTIEKLKKARADLQDARRKLKEAYDNPRVIEVPVEVIKEVPVEKVVYKEKRVEVPVEIIKEVTKKVPGPERLITKTVEVPVERIVTKRIRVKGPTQYVDNPDLIRQIEILRGKLNGRNSE